MAEEQQPQAQKQEPQPQAGMWHGGSLGGSSKVLGPILTNPAGNVNAVVIPRTHRQGNRLKCEGTRLKAMQLGAAKRGFKPGPDCPLLAV